MPLHAWMCVAVREHLHVCLSARACVGWRIRRGQVATRACVRGTSEGSEDGERTRVGVCAREGALLCSSVFGGRVRVGGRLERTVGWWACSVWGVRGLVGVRCAGRTRVGGRAARVRVAARVLGCTASPPWPPFACIGAHGGPRLRWCTLCLVHCWCTKGAGGSTMACIGARQAHPPRRATTGCGLCMHRPFVPLPIPLLHPSPHMGLEVVLKF